MYGHKSLTIKYKIADEMAPLLRVLVLLLYDSEAESLQTKFDALLKHVEKFQTEIWPPDIGSGNLVPGLPLVSRIVAQMCSLYVHHCCVTVLKLASYSRSVFYGAII